METRCQEHFTSTMFDTVEERWYCVRCLLLQVGELQKDMAQAMRIVEEYTYEDLAGIQSELMTKYKKPKGEVCNRCMDNFRRPSSDEGYVCDTCLAKEAKAVAGKRNHEGPPTPTDGSHRAGFRMGSSGDKPFSLPEEKPVCRELNHWGHGDVFECGQPLPCAIHKR